MKLAARISPCRRISFCKFYHNLINCIRISAVYYQLITEGKQSIENISSFLCCEVKVILLLFYMKITSALTNSVALLRILFIRPTHAI